MGATGTLRYSYDAAGLLSSQTDTATGETITYTYDFESLCTYSSTT